MSFSKNKIHRRTKTASNVSQPEHSEHCAIEYHNAMLLHFLIGMSACPMIIRSKKCAHTHTHKCSVDTSTCCRHLTFGFSQMFSGALTLILVCMLFFCPARNSELCGGGGGCGGACECISPVFSFYIHLIVHTCSNHTHQFRVHIYRRCIVCVCISTPVFYAVCGCSSISYCCCSSVTHAHCME